MQVIGPFCLLVTTRSNFVVIALDGCSCRPTAALTTEWYKRSGWTEGLSLSSLKNLRFLLSSDAIIVQKRKQIALQIICTCCNSPLECVIDTCIRFYYLPPSIWWQWDGNRRFSCPAGLAFQKRTPPFLLDTHWVKPCHLSAHPVVESQIRFGRRNRRLKLSSDEGCG